MDDDVGDGVVVVVRVLLDMSTSLDVVVVIVLGCTSLDMKHVVDVVVGSVSGHLFSRVSPLESPLPPPFCCRWDIHPGECSIAFSRFLGVDDDDDNVVMKLLSTNATRLQPRQPMRMKLEMNTKARLESSRWSCRLWRTNRLAFIIVILSLDPSCSVLLYSRICCSVCAKQFRLVSLLGLVIFFLLSSCFIANQAEFVRKLIRTLWLIPACVVPVSLPPLR